MRFGNYLFGVALILVATALTLTIAFRDEPEEESANERPGATTSAPSPARTRGISPSLRESAAKPHAKDPEAQVENLDLVLDQGPAASKLSAAESQVISERTSRVKSAALAKLGKMTERLDLTDEQRREIFPLLVRATAGYHPAMVLTAQAGGQAVPIEMAKSNQTTDEAIHEVLDPEQQEDFIEHMLNKQAWWNEIISQWEKDFDSTAAAGTAPDPTEGLGPNEVAPNHETSKSQERGNIFDLIK